MQGVKRLSRTKIGIIGAVVLMVAALLVVLAGRGDESAAVASGSSYQDRFGALEDFTPAVEADLSSLERERLSFRQLMMAQEMDPSNAGRVDELKRPEVRSYGRLELGQAGRVSMAAIGESVCAWYVKGVGICGTPEEIERTGVVGSSRVASDRWQVLAIVPQGVEAIEADPAGDGSFTFRVPVRSGVYSGEFPSRSIEVRGLGKSGEVIFRDTVPLDEFARGASS